MWVQTLARNFSTWMSWCLKSMWSLCWALEMALRNCWLESTSLLEQQLDKCAEHCKLESGVNWPSEHLWVMLREQYPTLTSPSFGSHEEVIFMELKDSWDRIKIGLVCVFIPTEMFFQCLYFWVFKAADVESRVWNTVQLCRSHWDKLLSLSSK